jgi:hypothetical protein
MVRKQLYLEEAQDKALKRQARKLGVSEAEVVRHALDVALRGDSVRPALKRNRELLKAFFEEADQLADKHRFAESYRFDRQRLYEEEDRFTRWDDEG